MWIFLALVAVPLIETALFVKVGGWIGFWPTIWAVILTAMAGATLLSLQGTATLVDLRNRLDEGGDPRSAIAHGIMIFIAGVLLMVPGFFTDAIGFLFLIRPVRTAAIRYVVRNIGLRMRTRSGGGGAWPDAGASAEAAETTIDGEYTDVTSPEGREASTPDPSNRLP